MVITTIIPTYKRPQLLKRAIRSVLAQTYPHIHICVYDNASNDETEEIVAQLAKEDGRITYYRHETMLRAPQNFQFGLDRVQTSFFSILADDDLLLPHVYEEATAALKSYPEAIFFLGSTIDVHENGNVISANALKWPPKELWSPPEGLYEILSKYINWTGALFRKEALQLVQIDPRLKAIDFDFVARLAAKAPFVFSKTPCALFMHHKDSYSSNCGAKLVWPGYQQLEEKLIQVLPESKNSIQTLLKSALSERLFRILMSAIAKQNVVEAKKALEIYQTEFQTPLRWVEGLLFFCEKSRSFSNFFSRAFYSSLRLKRRPLQKKYDHLMHYLKK